MGATTFFTRAKGKTARQAFVQACADARYMHGHGGYTGTIAEKRDFVIIATRNDKRDAFGMAEELIDECDPRIDDKWGPAGCIQIAGTDEFLFFGWASD
jgi:hypothetical protein